MMATPAPGWRDSGAILLVSCYELGHQPLRAAWPRAFLTEAGFCPATIDVGLQPLDPVAVRRARLIVIAVPMHTALRLGMTVLGRVRALNPEGVVCMVGLYAVLNADYLLDHGVDAIIGAEFEATLVELAKALEQGRQQVTGVTQRGQPASPILERLRFPVPDRTGLPKLARYSHLVYDGQRVPAGYVEASRGCLHHCRHCPIPPVYNGRFFVVPRDVVLADIAHLVAAGAQHITFGDPDFLNGPGHSLAIVRQMHDRFPDLTFDITAKVEHLIKQQRLLAELRQLGCLFIISAFESLSNTILGHLDKGHTSADAHRALQLVHDTGIALRPTWVAFTPWTTLDDYQAMLDFVVQYRLIHHIDSVQYTIRLLIPPGSRLLSQPAIRPYLTHLVPEHFMVRWRHSDPRMDALHTALTQVVEHATEAEEDAVTIFGRIRQTVSAFSRGHTDLEPLTAEAARATLPWQTTQGKPAPRLTEAWFCCAEPTEGHVRLLEAPDEPKRQPESATPV